MMFSWNLAFDYPLGLYLVALTFLFAFLFWALYRYRKEKLSNFYQNSQLRPLLHARSSQSFWIQTLCFCLAWVFAVIALADPIGNPHYPEESQKMSEEDWSVAQLKRKSHEVIFILDTSASMMIEDTRTGKTRLDYAKEIIDELIGHLGGESVSLYSFTSEMTQIVPATFDYIYTRLILRDVHENEGGIPGTNFVNMMKYLDKDLLTHSHSWNKTVIILSDGEDPQFDSLAKEEQDKFLSSLTKQTKEMLAYHAHFYTIGMGSEAGGTVPDVKFEGKDVHSSLHQEILKAISSNGEGDYFTANDYSVLSLNSELLEGINKDKFLKTVTQQNAPSHEGEIIYDHYYQIPLALAILCLFISLSIPTNSVKMREDRV